MLTPGHQKHITAANRCINTAVRWPVSPARAGQAAPTPAAAPRAKGFGGEKPAGMGLGLGLEPRTDPATDLLVVAQ